jgi:WD40 repeat protein
VRNTGTTASLYFVRNTELPPSDLHICAIAEDEEEEGDDTDEAEKLVEGEGEGEAHTANATTSGVTSSWRVTPLLASSSRDQTIRIWNTQTGSRTPAQLLDLLGLSALHCKLNFTISVRFHSVRQVPLHDAPAGWATRRTRQDWPMA